MEPTFNELTYLVEEWADKRGILGFSDPKTQMLKTTSEVGELADAIGKSDRPMVIDGIGDVLVTLIIQCKLQGLDITHCLNVAYTEIAGRKGEMVNGMFVKDGAEGQTC